MSIHNEKKIITSDTLNALERKYVMSDMHTKVNMVFPLLKIKGRTAVVIIILQQMISFIYSQYT